MDNSVIRRKFNRSGLVGSQNKTDQPVLTGSNEDQVGTVPTGPVGSDIIIDRLQPVAEGPVGQFSTRCPVGTDGMFSTSDSDQPMADGPVGRFITHSPVGPDHYITRDSDQPTADGPVGRFITHSPVGPDHGITSDSDQPTADGPVGRFITHSPVGPDHGITSDSDQPMADGPVGRFITHSPVGPDSITSACDPDRPVADDPVGQSFITGPVGPRRIFSPYELNQPVTVGPEDQLATSGPVGTHEGEPDCKRTDQISESPVGSTEILDRVKQTVSPSWTDFAKSGIVNEPASSGDTPPSSDLGVHSLGEQWENMSTSSMDMGSEQYNKPTPGNVSERRVSDSRVPPNTEEDEDIDYPWTDFLLNKGLNNNVSIIIQNNDGRIQCKKVTICENESISVDSGTDGVNSDIAALSDFSDDDEETRIEQPSGFQIPGCQCEGRIEFLEWGSDDMTETDDSEYDDPMDRANRLYAENYNYDLSEGMTPMTYNPPLRRNRRRRHEVRKPKEADIVESVSNTGDRDFQVDMGSPERTVVDDNFQDVSDNIEDRGGRPRTGIDQNIYSDEDSVSFDRPVARSATVGAWQDVPSRIDGINVGRMVIEEMREMASDEANSSADNYQGPVKQIAREIRRAWAENNAKPVEERESCQIPGCQWPCGLYGLEFG